MDPLEAKWTGSASSVGRETTQTLAFEKKKKILATVRFRKKSPHPKNENNWQYSHNLKLFQRLCKRKKKNGNSKLSEPEKRVTLRNGMVVATHSKTLDFFFLSLNTQLPCQQLCLVRSLPVRLESRLGRNVDSFCRDCSGSTVLKCKPHNSGETSQKLSQSNDEWNEAGRSRQYVEITRSSRFPLVLRTHKHSQHSRTATNTRSTALLRYVLLTRAARRKREKEGGKPWRHARHLA